MNAPMYLLGLTMTVGAVVSIPFLFISDWMCDKVWPTLVSMTWFLCIGLADWKDQRLHPGLVHLWSQIHWLRLHLQPLDVLPLWGVGSLYQHVDEVLMQFKLKETSSISDPRIAAIKFVGEAAPKGKELKPASLITLSHGNSMLRTLGNPEWHVWRDPLRLWQGHRIVNRRCSDCGYWQHLLCI